MPEHVILFAGPMGAGKTTAIESLSEIDVVRTEAANNDRVTADKETTTVALDYGEITVDDHDKIRLYGVPGQKRFDFMWAILRERAQGMILLVNNDAADPIGQTLEFMEEFAELQHRGGVVVGVTRSDLGTGPHVDEYTRALGDAYPGRIIPVFTIDPRSGSQMRSVLLTLISSIEMKALFESLAEVGE